MTVARSLIRIAFASFFVSSLIVACTVKDGSNDTSATCNPGDHKDCTCSGKAGQRECNDNGDGYGSCVCSGTVDTGGSSNGAGGDAGAGPVSNGGTKSYAGSAGTSNGGSISYAGQAAGGAGAGSVEVGGAGGAGEVTPLECQDPANDCETCYFGGCCDVYAPCVNDDSGTCLQQVADVLACTDGIKADRDVKTADLEQCAQDVGNTTSSWSASLSPLTVDVINCIAGEPGWEGSPWGSLACKASCFDK